MGQPRLYLPISGTTAGEVAGGSARTEKSVRDNLVTTNICHRALPLLFIHSTHQHQVKFETMKAPEVDDGDGRM